MKTNLVNRVISKFAHKNFFYDSIRPTDVFLVTYPKSGTTWLGFLLANVISGKSDNSLNLRTFITIVPDVNELYFHGSSLSQYSSLPQPRIFMVHAPLDTKFPRVVYVVRDPRDVMVSFWHHKRLTIPNFELSLRDFLKAKKYWPISWNEHVGGWLSCKDGHVLIIRYEDLSNSTYQVLKSVVEFIGLAYTKEILEQAIQIASFDSMQDLEKRFGVEGAHGSREERFIRKGKIGSWRDELDEETLRLVEKDCGRIMLRLGYKTESIAPPE